MLLWVAALFLSLKRPLIYAHYIDIPPKIDGIIEEIWTTADSTTQFTQMAPNEGEPASFKTTVYVLYDDENLYFAFRSESPQVTAYIGPWDDVSGDGVGVYLDTFNDGRTAYQFLVNARGIQGDAYVYNDGRNRDWTWDGVWYADAMIYEWGYVVEIKIPFKSIRYKQEIDTWGINFSRYVNLEGESDYWAPMKRSEELRVSKFGKLIGIRPHSKGRFLEIYPVGIGRNDKYEEKTERKAHLGLDIAWSPAPEGYFQVTFNPDFGEVEADPYILNLSKYRLYYRERRPFFVEGSDLFKVFIPSGMNLGPMVRLFYSRNIGRKLFGGEEVPISIGAKFLWKGKRYDGGILMARTEARESEFDSEPLSYYMVGRLKYAFSGNSTIGILYNGKEQPNKHRVRLLATDLSLRTSDKQFSLISAVSLNDSLWGKMLRSDMAYTGENFFGGANFTYIGRTFEINEIGFVPLVGLMGMNVLLGPRWYLDGGPFRSLFAGIGGGISKEFEEDVWESGTMIFVNFVLRSRWGLNLGLGTGRAYERGTYYKSKTYNLNLWSDWTKTLRGGFFIGGGYDFNYNRYYFAWHHSFEGWLNWNVIPNFAISLSLENTVEMDPKGKVEDITFVFRPRLEWSITKYFHTRVYPELVGTRSNRRVERIRFGGLLSYQIAPKSWLYLAINDLEENSGHSFVTSERISLFKIRYLILF